MTHLPLISLQHLAYLKIIKSKGEACISDIMNHIITILSVEYHLHDSVSVQYVFLFCANLPIKVYNDHHMHEIYLKETNFALILSKLDYWNKCLKY